MLIASYKKVGCKKEKQKKLESPVSKTSEPITKNYPNLVQPFIKIVVCLLVVLDLTRILPFFLRCCVNFISRIASELRVAAKSNFSSVHGNRFETKLLKVQQTLYMVLSAPQEGTKLLSA